MEKYFRTIYQKAAIIASIVCILFLLIIMAGESISPDWKKYQNEYKQISISKAKIWNTTEERLTRVGNAPNFGYAVGMMERGLLPDDDKEKVRDWGLTPEMPDFEYSKKRAKHIPKDKYPFWLSLGVVYEHFHTSKTIRSATNKRLLLTQYVEMNEKDAKRQNVQDGDLVKVITRRGHYEARVSIGINSKVKPARNVVAEGQLFSPWNLSVADSADPKENNWLVNIVSHRAFDPVSGQADFKKLAARIEKIEEKV